MQAGASSCLHFGVAAAEPARGVLHVLVHGFVVGIQLYTDSTLSRDLWAGRTASALLVGSLAFSVTLWPGG